MTNMKSSVSDTGVLDSQDQQHKVAIVTGASRGIGLEIANKLIANGYRVVGNSRYITSGTLVDSDDVQLVSGDIGDRDVAKQTVDAAIRKFGRIDLLVNNAGVFIPKPFTEYTLEDFRTVIETNLDGFFHVSQFAVAQMRARKLGHVINITASIANQPVAGVPATLSSLSKGGLESVTRALAIEYAGDGIRFNAIAPGVVSTSMHSAAAHDALRRLSPLGRLAETQEVAELVLYLESALFINGEVVHLDGGAHAGRW